MKSSSTHKIATRKVSDIDEIIIHCSATPAGRNFNADDIDRWHKAQGFAKIGYHYVVCPTGTIDPGREVREEGAHCIERRKHSTYFGICYVGEPHTDVHPARPGVLRRGKLSANFRPRREFFAPRLGGIWKFVITLLSPSASAPAPHGPAPRHRLAQTPLIHSEKQ